MNLQRQNFMMSNKNSMINIQLKLSQEDGLRGAVEDFERRYILHILHLNNGQKGKTAENLGIDRKTLYLKMKKYEMC